MSGGGARVGRLGWLADYPALLAQWHPTRNGTVDPAAVRAGSRLRVWWRCAVGHEWQTRVWDLVVRNSGCPACRGQWASETYNLALAEPEVAASWHPDRNGQLTAAQLTPRSGRWLWWRCAVGHEWQMVVHHRVERGCPFCERRRVSPQTSLAAVYPELAAQWHPTRNGDLTPELVLPGSTRMVWWRCSVCAHEWAARPTRRVHRGSGCRVCAVANKRRAEAPLTVTHPAVAAQWHVAGNGVTQPDEVTYGSHRRVWWRCERGHVWDAAVRTRTRGAGCPYCTGRQASAESNLAVVCPDLAGQWHPTRNGALRPEQVTPHSAVVTVWWRCAAGHEWSATPHERWQAQRCPGCVAAPNPSLATALPAIAAQWHPTRNGALTPRDVEPRSRRAVWWRCPDCAHEWRTPIKNRSRRGGCPICGRVVRSARPKPGGSMTELPSR